jgi:hypothetical protein
MKKRKVTELDIPFSSLPTDGRYLTTEEFGSPLVIHAVQRLRKKSKHGKA